MYILIKSKSNSLPQKEIVLKVCINQLVEWLSDCCSNVEVNLSRKWGENLKEISTVFLTKSKNISKNIKQDIIGYVSAYLFPLFIMGIGQIVLLDPNNGTLRLGLDLFQIHIPRYHLRLGWYKNPNSSFSQCIIQWEIVKEIEVISNNRFAPTKI